MSLKIKFLAAMTFLILFYDVPVFSQDRKQDEEASPKAVKLFLAGDVMSGRGIDQAFAVSVDPVLYEPYVKDARDYLLLAEKENGRLKIPLSYSYVWGEALKVWQEKDPQLRLVNLETSITTHPEPWPGKGIQYRMHPANVEFLKKAGIDHVSLGNNHVLDWKHEGLEETIEALKESNIAFSGAGKSASEAAAPSVIKLGSGRLLVFSYASPGSGVPESWAAKKDRAGVNFLPAFNEAQVENIAQNISAFKKEDDIVIFSIHWGPNWGYTIPESHQVFAHSLIDKAGVDLIFGHSSHHPLGLEVYNEKLIIYGAGDFLNDYEGIGGHEEFRPELVLMYFPVLEINTGNLVKLEMQPMKIKNLRLNKASGKEAAWLQKVLDRESRKFEVEIVETSGELEARWKRK